MPHNAPQSSTMHKSMNPKLKKAGFSLFDHSILLRQEKSPVTQAKKPDSVVNKAIRQYQNGIYTGGVQLQRALGNQAMIRMRHLPGSLPVKATADLIRDNDVSELGKIKSSNIIVCRSGKPKQIMRLPAEPYVRQINVNLDTPQSVSIDWQGTPPEGVRNTFRCSTGKGYSDPGDPPGTCNRDCCIPGINLCESPYDQRESRGSCCTPVGDFAIQHKDREHRVIGGTIPFWMYFYRSRGIAIHEYFPVTGTPISHGCVRLDSVNAEMLFNYSHERVTSVSVTGTATPACPAERQCTTSAAEESLGFLEERQRLAGIGQKEIDQAV